MGQRIARWTVILLIVAGTAPAGVRADETWLHYGGDAGGQRYSPHTDIHPGNVAGLEVAWIYRTGDSSGRDGYPGESTFKATPVLYRDRLYVSTPFNRVLALAASSGEELWSYDPDVDFSGGFAEMYTSRGVSLWTGDGGDDLCAARVLLGTLDARLLALDAATGTPCRAFGANGTVDLSAGIRNYRAGEYSVTSPPVVVGDVIVVGSSVGDNGAVELDRGNVRGYDARSGALLWDWDPIPRRKGMPGYDTWSRDGARRTGAANAWSVLSADAGRGLVYVPTTSPSPDFYGGVRAGDNLFANSVVALDVLSGKRAWHFQTVHHDLWDYDLAAQPVLTTLRRNGAEQDVVLQATKTGFLYVLDRDSGKPVFPVEERPVPPSDVPGESASPTQPFPVRPAPLHPARATADDIWPLTPEHEAYCRDLLSGLRNEGMFTPPSLGGTLVYPGNPGGVNWGSVAVDTERQLAVTVVRRWPTVVTLLERREFNRQRRSAADDPLQPQYTAQRGTPYGMKRHHFINPANRAPCLKGPWGTVVAVDLVSGNTAWERPAGVFPGLDSHPQAQQWGSMPSGGAIVTASGLVFAATEHPAALHAWDIESGEALTSLELPAGAQATPMSYRSGNRQFIVVTAGAADPNGGRGDYVVAVSTPIAD